MSLNNKIILQALMRKSLSAFIQKSFDIVTGGEVYLHNWHIDLIAQHLEACARGDIRRLIITMPPRYMKSICASVAFPAWLWGQNPNAKIIQASYSQELSTKHSIDCRKLIESHFYQALFPNTKLETSPNTKSEYLTTRKGFRLATSVGGTLTGRGGDFLIIDDPLKPQEAHSEVSRKNVNDWFDNTLYSRLNNKKDGCIIIIMQRLHEDDLVGHVLNQEEWVHLNLPALCESREIIDIAPAFVKAYQIIRNPGEALHPERESAAELVKLRDKILGSYTFSSQYQQNPAPYGGGLIKLKWFKRYDCLPDEPPKKIFQSWDTASKAEEIHDYSVCTTWYEYEHGWYLVNVFRERLEFPDLIRQIPRHAALYNARIILIEDKGSGISLIQDLKRRTKLNIMPIIPKQEKQTRMIAQTPRIETGKVYIPNKADWLPTFENEIMHFPNSRHDDQIDSMSQALEWSYEKNNIVIGFTDKMKKDIHKTRYVRREEKLW